MSSLDELDHVSAGCGVYVEVVADDFAWVQECQRLHRRRGYPGVWVYEEDYRLGGYIEVRGPLP